MASVIVMAIVSQQASLSELLGLANSLVQNTLRPEQCGHHATLALKPENPDVVVAEYAAARFFECQSVRHGQVAGGEICAVFGRLIDETGQQVGRSDLHITLAGTVSPSHSKALAEGAVSQPVSGVLPVTIEVWHL